MALRTLSKHAVRQLGASSWSRSFAATAATDSPSLASEIVIEVDGAGTSDRGELLKRVDEAAAHDMMVLARMKAQQPLFARAVRFFKTRVVPYENLPGVTFEQAYDSFRHSFRLPTSFAEFIEAAPALYRQVVTHSENRDWAALRKITSRSAAESLQCLYERPSSGHLELKTEVLKLRQAIVHDVSLISEDLYNKSFEVPRPLLDPSGNTATSTYTTTRSVAEGRAIGVKDGLTLLKEGPCYLAVKAEIEADVRDTVTEASSGAVRLSHVARHLHMWTFIRGPITYADDAVEEAKGTHELTWRQAGHRGLGHRVLEARGVGSFGEGAAWRVADVSPWNASLARVLEVTGADRLPKIIVNRKK